MKKPLFVALLVLGSVLIASIVGPYVYVMAIHRVMGQTASEAFAAMHGARLVSSDGHTIRDAATGQILRTLTPPPPPTPASDGIVLTDLAHDKTENNFLARLIIDEVLKQAYYGVHPNDPPLSNLTDQYLVGENQTEHTYSIDMLAEVPGLSYLQLRLTVPFVWAATAYMPVAQPILGNAKASIPDPEAGDMLARMLEPSGHLLAREDMRLSALLQKNPLDAAAHEEAALLLISLALRENAGDFSDIRLLLCRATAHLAIAGALNGNSTSWNYRIADIALNVLAGRESSAIPMLDDAFLKPDLPPAAKSWIDALRIWTKEDVTGANVTAGSPRLVKIAWFQTLARNLPLIEAEHRLEQLGTPDAIVDWSRALLSQREIPVEIGNTFCHAAIDLEKSELADILAVENGAPMDDAKLADFFSEKPSETVLPEGSGHTIIHVVGLGAFKAATRHHLFQDILRIHDWLKDGLGDEAGTKDFVGQTTALYKNVPFFEDVAMDFQTGADFENVPQILTRENKTWDIADLPPVIALGEFSGNSKAAALANSYFLDSPPFGTAFDDRLPTVFAFLKTGPDWHRDPYDLDPKSNVRLLFIRKLMEMHPSSYPLTRASLDAQGDLPAEPALTTLAPFMKYNIHAFDYIDTWDERHFHLTDEQKEDVFKARCALDSNVYFAYGDFLKKRGRIDEAMDAYRKGVAQATDQVLVSNSLQALVDYDMDHGRKDEAKQMAEKAAMVGSAQGLITHMTYLEKSGDLDGAEKEAIAVAGSYDAMGELISFYLRHADKFPGKLDAIRKQDFPDGMTPVTIDSFKNPPERGVLIKTESNLSIQSDIRMNDVVVAFNGTRTDNMAQYNFIRLTAPGPVMDLIVWREGRGYGEIKASPPNYLFGIDLDNYSAN